MDGLKRIIPKVLIDTNGVLKAMRMGYKYGSTYLQIFREQMHDVWFDGYYPGIV
jgi:hypothetical protein